MFLLISLCDISHLWTSPWWPSNAVTSVIRRYNPVSNNPFEAQFLLLWSCIQYSGQEDYLPIAPLRDTEIDPLNPVFMFCRLGHSWWFLIQCARSCTPTSLLSMSSFSQIYYAVFIRRWPHHLTSLLVSPMSRLSATYMLMLSQCTYVSTSVYPDIHINQPCHLVCLLLMSLSTFVSPVVLIRCRLQHRLELHFICYHKIMEIYPYPFLVVITLLFS